jgi:glutamyl/glutaminyl-tRNA synthetase
MTNKTRIAPTPNGHIHLGNIMNFIHTYMLSKQLNSKLFLRIDDHDFVRCKREYVEEIFRVFDILKINFDGGPSGVDDFYHSFSQKNKSEYYFEKLKESENYFVCECSRRDVFKLNSQGIYSGTCRTKNLELSRKKNLIRFSCPKNRSYFNGKVDLDQDIGDTILWRRDDIVSYQWMSVCEDLELGTTHFIRGEDLISSSAIQIEIANSLGRTFPCEESFIHHKLVTKNGEKLSKSRGDIGVIEDLSKFPHKYIEMYCDFFGIEKVSSMDELTRSFL